MRRKRSFAEWSFNGLGTIFGEGKVDRKILAINWFNDMGLKGAPWCSGC
jgi:hypothetical protein